MQATQSISLPNRQNTPARRKALPQRTEGGASKVFAAKKQWNRYDFLNSQFKPIPKVDVLISQNRRVFSFENGLSEQNPVETYDQLLKCLMAYASIRKVSLEIPELNTIGEKFIWISNTMKSLISYDPKLELNVEYDYEVGAHFVIYKEDWYFCHNVYLIPIENIKLIETKVSDKIFKCLFDSICLLIHSANIPTFREEYFELVLEFYPEVIRRNVEELENDNEELDEDELALVQIKLDQLKKYSGKYGDKILRNINRKSLSKSRIKKQLTSILTSKSYKKWTDLEKKVINLTYETLNLCRPNESIYNYDYAGDYPQDECIKINQYVAVTINDSDYVTEMFLETINDHSQELAITPPTEYHRILPNTKTDIKLSEWIREFQGWHDNLYKIINEITK